MWFEALIASSLLETKRGLGEEKKRKKKKILAKHINCQESV